VEGGRGDLLSSIRGAGGINALKKAPASRGPTGAGKPPTAAATSKPKPPENPMQALQEELNRRKGRVSNQSGEFLVTYVFRSE
jgi:Wiskott-Aldrich syndrome protein